MSTGASRTHRVFEFYCAGAEGPPGRTLNDVLAFTPEQYEDEHDYIQWLFPLKEQSEAVPSSPVTNDEEIASMRAHPEFIGRFQAAQRAMLGFYGFALALQGQNDMKVVRLSSYAGRSAIWLFTRPHNFKRLSRILRSLRLFGMNAQADALRTALEDVYMDSAGKLDRAIRLELDKAVIFWRKS